MSRLRRKLKKLIYGKARVMREEAEAAAVRDEARRRAENIARHAQQRVLETHDFSYESGERQTATSLSGIREDHVDRYRWALEKLATLRPEAELVGGDYFCGNGYGTAMLAERGQVTGFDGSTDAIEAAKAHFDRPGTRFEQVLFPFELDPGTHDFIVSMESVEHVQDYEGFLTTLHGALKPKGLLFMSTPNEALYPFDPAVVFHHIRHFTAQDVRDITSAIGFREIDAIGQKRVEGHDDLYERCALDEGRFQIFVFEKADAAT